MHTSASGSRFYYTVCVCVRNLAAGSFPFVCLLNLLRLSPSLPPSLLPSLGVCVGGVCGAQLQREAAAERGLADRGAAAQHGHAAHRPNGESTGEVHRLTGQWEAAAATAAVCLIALTTFMNAPRCKTES